MRTTPTSGAHKHAPMLESAAKQLNIYPALFCMIMLAVLACAPAHALGNTYYVSKNGNNKDGKSWATAWNELNQINWSQAGSGDTILIDGGATQMVYNTTLTVNVSGIYFTTVKLAPDSGRHGQVVIQGSGSSPVGIEVGNSTYVTITGTKSKGIVVNSHTGDGIHVSPGANFVTLQQMQISNNQGAGVHLAGQEVMLMQSILNDNRTNVLMDAQPVHPYSQISTCWIYNSTYSYNNDGIYINEPNLGITSMLTVTHSILGPGLRNCVNLNSNKGLTVSDSLLINATKNNVTAVSTWDQMTGITMFSTSLNPKGVAHSNFNLPAPPVQQGINRTIVYGGKVSVPAGSQSNNYQNTQFKTKGNTTYLSSTEVDPKFVTNVGAYANNVSIQQLINTDFSLQPGSPAQGTGSSVTSVTQLLGQM